MRPQRVIAGEDSHFVACCRAEEMLDTLPDACVSLMTLDFPYFQVCKEDWDNAWPTPEAFIAWMGGVLAKCRRVLAPNGSIYVFAASQVRGGLTMATRVEVEFSRHFAVLGRATWQKEEGTHRRIHKPDLRWFCPQSEVVIAGEQPAFSCEPVRAYLDGERRRAGASIGWIRDQIGFTGQMPYHWFAVGMPDGTCQQWQFPTEEHYSALQRLCRGFFLRPYAELRAEFEALRRPFTVSAAVPYTDVWTYETVNAYPGKHPCEKPFLMAENMIAASSRPGDLVADFFCGSGAFLAAAVHSGRRAIGCDMDPAWADFTRRRIESGPMQWRDFGRREGRKLRTVAAEVPGQLGLFRSA